MANSAAPLITLTTDFGTRDPYAAVLKGVLLSRCPEARICDLSHDIAPHNVLEAALFLETAAPWFPPSTVHIAVVDPGVGSERAPIAAAAGGQRFVCPDNGVLSLVLQQFPDAAVHRIENPACIAATEAQTFHGRDIFAPAAAWLAVGNPLSEIGPPHAERVKLPVAEPELRDDGTIHGQIIHVDHFGNCISNVPRNIIEAVPGYKVQIGAVSLPQIDFTYSAVPQGALLALFGSSGRLEIARREGSAQRDLGVSVGDPLTLYRP